MTILISIALILLCCVIIWRASDGFEVASEYLGRNLSEGVRGATINAIGSSMPELFTTLFFLLVLHDKDGFAGGIGTTAGSAIFNGMIIPAVVILVVIFKGLNSSVEVSRKVLLRDGIALLLCEFVLIIILGGNVLSWEHGLVLMLLYAAYATYMMTSMNSNVSQDSDDGDDGDDGDDSDDGDEPRGSMITNILTLNLEPVFIRNQINSTNGWTLLIATMTVIGGACLLLVKSCEWLGDDLGLPIYFIAVVLASAATSVPDTILSMKDAQKGNYDDAVSNALGSNIFDVCFALGLPLFVYTIIYGPIEMSAATIANVSELRILLFILTFVAFIIYISKKKLTGIHAILLLAIYCVFTIYIIGRATEADFAKQISEWLLYFSDLISTIRIGN